MTEAATPAGRTALTPISCCQTVSVEIAGKILGYSRNTTYEAVKNGQLPVIRLGRKIRVPKVALKRMLAGLPPDGPCTGNGRADNLRGVND